MAFENSTEQLRPSEVHQPSTAALLPTNHDYQNFFTPNPRRTSEPGFLDFGQSDIYSQNKYVLAQKIQFSIMPYQIEPALNQAASDGLGTVGKIAEDQFNQRRAVDEVNRIPHQAWSDAYKAFPELQSHFSEKQATALMKAIIANEAEHYDAWDMTEYAGARAGLTAPRLTIGDTQLSLKAISDDEHEFPKQLGRFKNNEREALLDPANAPVLVAATLAHYVRQFEKYNYPISSESLGYAYNPDLYASSGHKDIMPTKEKAKTSEHARNIRSWLSVFFD